MSVAVRRLSAADVLALRELRLEALRLEPSNLGADWEDEATRPLSMWRHMLEHDTIFGAELNGTLCGMAGLFLRESLKRGHIATLGAFYVRANARGHGVGAKLLDAILKVAHEKKRSAVLLSMTDGNDAAMRLYARFGFVVCGRIPRAINVRGVYYDELSMIAEFHQNYPLG